MIRSQQAQHPCRFLFAIAPGSHQLLEKDNPCRPELGEPLFQQFVFLMVIPAGGVLRQAALLSTGSRSVQFMAGDLLHVRAVDDQFLLGDAYRQQFSDPLPRHRVEVLQVRHLAFRVHRPVKDLGRVVGPRRQTQQVRFLFLVQIDGPPFGFPVNAHIGGLGEPLCCDLVQVLQRSERAAVEQVLFEICKWSLHLAFGLRPMWPACPWLKPVVRGEGQKSGVVDRLVAIVARHHDFHVVVQAGGRRASQILKRSHVFSDGRGKVLCLYKPQVLPPRVTQNVAERVHPPPPFGGENDVVRRVIHLCLHSWSCLETLDRQFGQVRTKHAQPVPHDGVVTFEPQPAQFLMQANRRQVRVAFQHLCHLTFVWVQQTGPPNALLFRLSRPLLPVIRQHPRHAPATHPQLARDAALRAAAIMQSDDLVAGGLLHARRSSSPMKSCVNPATDPASRASL